MSTPPPYAAPAPVPAPVPVKRTPPPVPGGLAYHQLLRVGRPGWAWSLLGLAVLTAGFLLASVVVIIPFAVAYALAGGDSQAQISALADTANVTPSSLAFLNLTLAAAIPSAMLAIFVANGMRPAWLASVVPRIRWRWLGMCAGLAVIALLATVAVSAVVPAVSTGVQSTPRDFTSTTRDFLLVILLLTPLQAAGEEYAFRGYLTQAFGRIFDFSPRLARVAAVLLPALLFALAHGAQDAPIFVDRFAFGVVAGILVIATGGLEAGIAMHVLNNFLAYGLALAFSDMSSALNPTGGSWWNLPVTLTQSLVYLGLAVTVARRTGLRTTTEAGVFEASRRRV